MAFLLFIYLKIEDDMTFAWIVVEHGQIRGESRSASLMLPEQILKGIREEHLLKSEFYRVDFCWIRSGCNDMIHNEFLMLPEQILKGIREGRELGDEMAFLTKIDNIKQRGGAIGFYRVDFCWIRSGCNDMIHNELIIL